MKKIKLKSLMLAIGLVVCSVAGAVKVFAEGENSSTLIVSPMTQKIILIPGEASRGSPYRSSRGSFLRLCKCPLH